MQWLQLNSQKNSTAYSIVLLLGIVDFDVIGKDASRANISGMGVKPFPFSSTKKWNQGGKSSWLAYLTKRRKEPPCFDTFKAKDTRNMSYSPWMH
jgi:hypothetical protein